MEKIRSMFTKTPMSQWKRIDIHKKLDEDEDGDVSYCYGSNRLHRYHNPHKPSIHYGSISYYIDGQYHNIVGPAWISSEGEKDYHINNDVLYIE